MRYTTNETITIFRRKKSTNINRVIDKYNLNDNFYNSHINICNYFYMKKTKKNNIKFSNNINNSRNYNIIISKKIKKES